VSRHDDLCRDGLAGLLNFAVRHVPRRDRLLAGVVVESGGYVNAQAGGRSVRVLRSFSYDSTEQGARRSHIDSDE
jgi:hypothetical protein